MAACTFALRPSSANDVVCKRTVLRLRHTANPRATRVGASVGNQSAGGAATKGLTGKLMLGERINESNPLRPLPRLDGIVRPEKQGEGHHASVGRAVAAPPTPKRHPKSRGCAKRCPLSRLDR